MSEQGEGAMGESEERERIRYAMLGLVAEWRAIAIANGKPGSPVHESCATELEKEVALLRAGPTSEPVYDGEESVGFLHFPRQGAYLGKRTVVCLNYDSTLSIGGTVVRDDMELPGLLIIRLDDDRHVLATECQYSMPRDQATKATPPEGA